VHQSDADASCFGGFSDPILYVVAEMLACRAKILA
jgi:hypothetical protein